MASGVSDGDLTLIANGQVLSGWTKIRVTRGIERCPNDFDLELTEVYPSAAVNAVINPFDPCAVQIGGDLVLTGYIDDYLPELDANKHTIRATGRGKCGDLVDCSAEWPSGQISGTSAFDVATKLAQPYGISVSNQGPAGPAIPQFNLSLGETAYEIIERLCRYAGLLLYEDPTGTLILNQVGTALAATGLIQGQNLERARFKQSGRERYSAYKAFLMSVEQFGDAGTYSGNLIATATDPNVPRHRLKYLIAESVSGGADLAKLRALWEAARRFGRSYSVTVTTDSWRDGAGALWVPNTLVPVDIPALKISKQTWIAGEISHLRDEKGDHAELILCPGDAFLPEPIQLQPILPDAH